LAEYVIFYINNLDKFTGEQIIALDILKKKNGILSYAYEVDETRLNSMIKGTVLEKYRKVESSKIKEELNKLEPLSREGKTKIVIDHCFDVKGVGTVVLGKVVSGKVKQYDNMKLLPAKHDVMIKSIQMHDNPVEEAASPARVGLSIKGVKSEDVSRGDVLYDDDTLTIKSEFELEFSKNPYYKGEITENQMCLISVGLQIKAAKFSSVNPIKLKLEKPVVIEDEIVVVLKPESDTIRILGSGIVKN